MLSLSSVPPHLPTPTALTRLVLLKLYYLEKLPGDLVKTQVRFNMVRGGRREEGSGWGTRVYLWQTHVDIWQNQYNIVKLKNKIKLN